MAVRYSDFCGHTPLTSVDQLPAAVGGVRTIAAGRWKLGAALALPAGERLVLAAGASLSGEDHTEHVISGDVAGAALVTLEGDGGAMRGRAPSHLSVVNANAGGGQAVSLEARLLGAGGTVDMDSAFPSTIQIVRIA